MICSSGTVPSADGNAERGLGVPRGVHGRRSLARPRLRVQRGSPLMDVEFTVDGAEAHCAQGLTVAAAIVQLRRGPARTTARDGAPRGLFCGMGVCFDCVMQ